MAYTVTFKPDVQRVLKKLRKHGQLVLAMLYKRQDSPESAWNFILSAPWTDRMGAARAIDLVTRALGEELDFEHKQLISRVTVLPTRDPFVSEITSMYEVTSSRAEQWVTNFSAAGIPIGIGYIFYSRAH